MPRHGASEPPHHLQLPVPHKPRLRFHDAPHVTKRRRRAQTSPAGTTHGTPPPRPPHRRLPPGSDKPWWSPRTDVPGSPLETVN
ncbi:hypothetical protein H0H92_003491 [Tricholoma furcatifolium]|nr:hypothetical protein H0H92_003491 [Tricholoma furcatifolium]